MFKATPERKALFNQLFTFGALHQLAEELEEEGEWAVGKRKLGGWTRVQVLRYWAGKALRESAGMHAYGSSCGGGLRLQLLG